jgi:hypothetical protein
MSFQLHSYRVSCRQSRFAFDEAEQYYLVTDTVGLAAIGFQRSTEATTVDVHHYEGNSTKPRPDGDLAALPLSNLSVACHQGFLKEDAEWNCYSWPVSHRVCGHPGVFAFSSLTYSINEQDTSIRITVTRSGGGLGRATVMYNLEHNTTT